MADEVTGRANISGSESRPFAGVAQLVEQLIRNQQVRGSSPRAGSKQTQSHQRLASAGVPAPSISQQLRPWFPFERV